MVEKKVKTATELAMEQASKDAKNKPSPELPPAKD